MAVLEDSIDQYEVSNIQEELMELKAETNKQLDQMFQKKLRDNKKSFAGDTSHSRTKSGTSWNYKLPEVNRQ
jgi:hypothetical protein